MVQNINNVGSQQALENNWNDENAMRKFERATEGASRQRKDEIQASKQKPNSVELRASSKSVGQKTEPAEQEPSQTSFEALVTNNGDNALPALQAEQLKTSNGTLRYLVGALFLVLLVAVIGYVYII